MPTFSLRSLISVDAVRANLIGAVLLACAAEPPSDESSSETTTLATSTTPTTTFDCGDVPDLAQAPRTLDGPRGSKGLAFDDAGNIVGSNGPALIKADFHGSWSVLMPAPKDVEGMVYLPGGDLVLTSSFSHGHLWRVTPEGGRTQIGTDMFAYSVILGPDGMLYAAGWGGAWRVDPNTGDTTTLISNGSARTLAFDRDRSRLYIGTVDDRGRIFMFDLDDDLRPLGEPEVFAEGVGRGWHDGLGVDACGNVYAADFETSTLYRVSPDGADVVPLVDWSDEAHMFGHGLMWGTGEHGWRSDALYVPTPEGGNVVQEIVIGVPEAR